MANDHNELLADALLTVYTTQFPSGSVLEFRTGAQAGAENAAGGTLLAAITLPSAGGGPWGTPTAGVLLFAGVWQTSVSTGGVAAHWRLRNAADTRRLEGAITDLAGAGPMKMASTLLIIGQVLTPASFTLRLP